MRKRPVAMLILLFVGYLATAATTMAVRPLQVVSTLTSFQAVARELVDADSNVQSIASARQDAHFVTAKPSYSIMLSNADLLIGTGLDLELWLPPVVDKSRNPRIRPGEPGFVGAALGVPMLEVPNNPSRAAGDIHLYGNPHVHTDPLRAVIIADNVRVGLQRVDPQSAASYQQRFDAFKERIHRRFFGNDLVDLIGGDKLARLKMAGRLLSFLQNTELGGAPLSDRIGGWMQRAACLRGTRIVPYHPNWIYFLDRFGIEAAGYVERRPGIPPSAAHVAELVDIMERDDIRILWVANYFNRRVPELIVERTGATLAYVPLSPDPSGAGEASDLSNLYDLWIESLRAATPACTVA
jgi:ABC-type Zn uptake system ZnuABC Zn-binding protein ZnuA